MADYYPLIARAIAGLDPNAPGESRRALYERARTALIAQLRSVQPPLSESEITRERLSLEEAVRKVESEAAQRAREASRPGGGGAARGGDAFRRANARPPESAGPPGAPPGPPRQRPPGQPPFARGPSAAWPGRTTPAAQSAPRCAAARRAAAAGAAGSDAGCRPAAAAPSRQWKWWPPPRPLKTARPPMPPQPPGMRGFRDIAADADDLGRAAAQANRAARKTYANVPSPSPEFDRLEPSMENRGADPDAPYSYDESLEEADRYAPQPPQPASRERPRLSQDRDREPKQAAHPHRRRVSVQERDCGRHRAHSGRRRHPVGQVGGHRRERPVSNPPPWRKRRRIRRRPSRGRRSPIVSASRRRARTWRRWRSASCCMTKTRPIPRASNMSAR
jgi:hypothetical protein